MAQNKFQTYSINARERNTAQISDFGGVDFSSPRLQVADNRATDILNFIKKNGVNQKRKGWEQVGVAPSFTYHKYVTTDNVSTKTAFTNPKQFNGIWRFKAEDNAFHTVAHIGKCLFEVTNLDKDHSFKDISFTALCEQTGSGNTLFVKVIELLNDKTQAFVGSNRLYILGGNKYLVLRFYVENGANKWRLVQVEDSDLVYIPTTTIGTTYTDSPVVLRKLLDDVNLLSSLRKNKMLSGTITSDSQIVRSTRYYEYELDTNINLKEAGEVDNFKIDIEYAEKVGD